MKYTKACCTGATLYISSKRKCSDTDNATFIGGLKLFYNLYFVVCYFKNIGEELARGLTEREDILNYLFVLLTHDKTCLNACQFLEDLLQARRTVLNLQSISRSSVCSV